MSDEVMLDLARDVREGLARTPKSLPARLFYDAAGSELFEQITELPEYYVTRTETAIFEAHAREIVEAVGGEVTAIELGAGSARKTQLLLRALLERQGPTTFIPVDVSGAALAGCKASLERALPDVTVEPLEGRYRVALQTLRGRPGRKLVLFIGSSIGNFDPAEALKLLRDIRASLAVGDALLLGTDLRKDPGLLVPAYDDAQGVTARFNKNVLARINRELDANFELDGFRHVAVWNEGEGRMEMHLEAVRAQEVWIEGLGLRVTFAGGERIHTENSYKFTEAQVDELLRASGFERRRTWTDARGWFAEHLAFASGDA